MDDLDQLPRAASIEFPLDVRHIDRAIDLVGGVASIADIVSEPELQLELRLRPDDPFHHPIASRSVDCHLVVLEIELPRELLDSVGGNVPEAISRAGDRVQLRPAYLATTNHRFRDMADFQYYTGDSAAAQLFRRSLYPGNLPGIFDVPIVDLDEKLEQAGLHGDTADLLPPPRFSLQTQPFHYNYKQNPSISLIDDGSGAPKLVNRAPRPRLISAILKWGDPVPTEPSPELERPPRKPVQVCVEKISKLFEDRPCFTRRALDALLPPELRKYLRYALPYVAYFYRSGPWRGSYIKYGLNPTTDSSLAMLQVEHFRILSDDSQPSTADPAHGGVADPSNSEATSNENSNTTMFTFDGISLPSAPMLQLCDISDPFLRSYIDASELRNTVDANSGWFPADRMAVIRRVLRSELLSIRDNKQPLNEQELLRIVADTTAGVSSSRDEGNAESQVSSSEQDDETRGESDFD